MSHNSGIQTPDEFLRIPEAEKVARMSYATLRRRHAAGDDVGLRKNGRIVLFHLPTLQAFLRAGAAVPATR